MSIDFLAFDRWNIRGVDTNSLLRMYDQATEILHKSKSQHERVRKAQVSHASLVSQSLFELDVPTSTPRRPHSPTGTLRLATERSRGATGFLSLPP